MAQLGTSLPTTDEPTKSTEGRSKDRQKKKTKTENKLKKERKLNQKKEYPKKLESQISSWSKFETIHSRLS